MGETGTGLPDTSLLSGICTILHMDANMLLGIEGNAVVENHDIAMGKVIRDNMFAEPLAIEFGYELIPIFAQGLKTDLINQKRIELVKRTGMLMPLLRIRDNTSFSSKEVQIKSYDTVIYQVELQELDDDTYEQLIEQVFMECERNYVSLLNKQMVKTIIDNVKEQYPGVADGLVPEKISYLEMVKYLRSVIEEKGNIRDMIHILEELEIRCEQMNLSW